MTVTTTLAHPTRRTPPAGALALLVVCVVAVACLAALALLSLTLPTPRIGLDELVAVARGGGSPLARVVVLELRLPRLVLGMLAGAMLGLSGVLLQTALRNPLAGPELLGVTSEIGRAHV